MKKLKLLDTFAGIGGFSYAAEKLVGGFETTQFIEINPFCQKVLNKHWSHVPIHDDIKTFTAKSGEFEIITSGFPCQDLSYAGKGLGITKETRSGLFYELIRIVRMVRPKYVILENVAAILNRGLDIVLGELSEAGFDAEYAVISASSLGACHQRSRWFCVAINREFADPNGKRLERRLSEQQQELQKTGQPGQKDSLCSTDTDSSGTQSDSKKMESPIWKYAFLNSKERRTLSPNWRGYVSEPCLRRGDDGLSNRTHRLRALGNSVLPQCAAIPLQRVIDIEKNINK